MNVLRKIIPLILLTVLLLSCSNNETTDVGTPGQVINFNTINDKISYRSANATNDNYQVLAKEPNGTEWFINEMINGTTNVSMTGKIYYWYYPPVDIYFWAYAPAQDTSIVVNNTYPTSLLTVTIPVNADLDFTIADQLIKSSGMVALQFKHSLSKISFTIELVQDLVAAGYTITSQPTTTFNVNKWIGSISPVSDTLSWTTIDSTSVTYSGANTYVIMPQSAIGNSLIVKDVVIAKGESVIFSGDLNKYTIKSGDIPAISGNTQSADNFIMNSHYLISLEISSSSKDSADNSIFGDAILFSTTTLVDWDSINTTIIQP